MKSITNPTQLLRSAVSVVGWLSLGVLMVWQLFVLELDHPNSFVVLVFVGALMILAIHWASILAHELGHLLAALAMGLRILLVVVGPLKFVRDGPRLHIRMNWRSANPGYVIAVPRDGRDLRRRLLIFIGGGPLASIIMCLMFLVAVLVWNEPSTAPTSFSVLLDLSLAKFPWMPQSHAMAWLYWLLILNLLITVQTLLPGQMGGLTTDGGQLLSMVRDGPATERSLLLLSVIATSHDGVRPRDWDRPTMERIQASCDGSADDVCVNMYGYYHALDDGRIEQAGRLLDCALDERRHFAVEFTEGMLLEAAYFEAQHRHNAKAARRWLNRVEEGHVERQTRLRAEAAVLLAEGQWEDAADEARAGLAIVSDSYDRGGAIAEREWLEAILADCERQPARSDENDASTAEPGPE